MKINTASTKCPFQGFPSPVFKFRASHVLRSEIHLTKDSDML